jgi:hypothetical protein
MNFLARTRVNWEQSIEWAKRMTMMEGIMVGPSSGAVMKVYMCPHTHIYVRILLYMSPHTAIYVSSYYYICLHILLYL